MTPNAGMSGNNRAPVDRARFLQGGGPPIVSSAGAILTLHYEI
jgi:hypothetical protein